MANRAGQVAALRGAKKEQAPTRSTARKQGAQERRQVADARRQAKAAQTAARTAKTAPQSTGRTTKPGPQNAGRAAKAGPQGGRHAAASPVRGAVRRALDGARQRAAARRDGAVDKARDRRDRRTEQGLAAKRAALRKAPARRQARRALRRSAARLWARGLAAGLVSAPVGLVGCLSTPLGRKLGWRWLQHPGRRLFARLMGPARHARALRDAATRRTLADQEAAADAVDPHEIKDRVERPTHLIPRPTTPFEEIHVSGFKFEEAAAEMENAAKNHAPEGNMESKEMIDNLPEALQSIANTFQILAERSDQEFAFEKEVATGFDDIHRTLVNAVDAAEELAKLFSQVHEQDIARHEDPRNGTEAEKGWNV
ncbi:hypothetical protein [Streptomyces sp. NPDC088360]|uniref:hypothetical protein n=1 Tax=Streptomyces sp. NPDC088360 TaxID=3154515 RepID=UPI00345085A0